MTAVDVLGRVDELTDGTGGPVDAVMGAGPYRKSRFKLWFKLLFLGLAALLPVSSSFAQTVSFLVAENPTSETTKRPMLEVTYDRSTNLLSMQALQAPLEEPGKEREREKAAEGLLAALLDRLNNNDVSSYSDAIAALKELAPEKVVRALSDRLQGNDLGMRLVAAAGLGFLRDEGAIEPLVSALTGTDSPTRQEAANNLVWIGGQKAMDALFHAYFARDNGVKRAVAVAIASHGDNHSREFLATLIAQGQGPSGPPLNDLSAREDGDVGHNDNRTVQ